MMSGVEAFCAPSSLTFGEAKVVLLPYITQAS